MIIFLDFNYELANITDMQFLGPQYSNPHIKIRLGFTPHQNHQDFYEGSFLLDRQVYAALKTILN